MKYVFSDLVDVEKLRPLLEGFTNASGAATAILDMEGNVLVATGWHEICTRFHRIHPMTCARCVESDTILASGLEKGEKYNLYQCRNGLVDVAMPIVVEGVHVGNIFTGQFLLEPPDPERFRRQAAEFGFDEAAYLDALARVPVFTHDQIAGTIDFLSSLVEIIGTMGLAKKRLLATNAELNIRNRIADVFLAAADKDVHQEILGIVLDAVGSPQGGFACLDENGHLACRASVGGICAQCPVAGGDAALSRESRADALCCRALTDKKTVCSNHPWPQASDGPVIARRHACLPIVFHDDVLGLVLAADKATDYDEDDIRMLEGIGDYIAPILYARLEANRQERDRRRAEEERSRLIAILESTSDMVATATPEGRVTYMNLAGRGLLGLTDDEDVSRQTIAESHPPDAEAVLKEAVSTAERNGIWTGANVLVRRDGTEIPVSQVVMVHRAKDGRIEFLSTIMRDVTAQKEAAKRINRLGRIIERSRNEIYIFDAQTYRFIQVNRGARDNLGYSMEELRNLTVVDLKPEFTRETFDQMVAPLWSGEKDTISFVTMHRRKNGSLYPVEVYLQLTTYDTGPAFVAIVLDITERRQAEMERENLIARLETQNAELERFVYTVSHDLKTPLITMKGFLGVLKEDMAREDAPGVADDLRRMEGAAKVMTGLLGDLVNLSRIGRLVQPSHDVPLGELVQEAVELAAIAAHGVQVDIEPDLPVVFGDHRRLLEVFQNLIENAVKYKGDQPRPQIEIGAREQGDQWLFHVRDNGIGIDPRYHEKIFDLFEQLDPNSEGSGIGLTLVKRIVEFHGGRIWVESDGPGHGSTFYFTLPREAGEAIADG